MASWSSCSARESGAGSDGEGEGEGEGGEGVAGIEAIIGRTRAN